MISTRLAALAAATAAALVLGWARPALAQDPPPPIGPFVIDIRGVMPSLGDDPAVAASRGLSIEELPGRSLGVEFGAHGYPFRLGKVTIGFGGQVMFAHAHKSNDAPLRPVTSNTTSLSPQLSLNFGSGDGWSYLSGGIGATKWSLVPDGGTSQTADEAWVRTFDVGGGARWFMRPHVAFHLDFRWHTIEPGPVQATLPQSPRTRFTAFSVGASIKPF